MSGSADAASGWRAGAWVYSGREDPSWPLNDRQAGGLVALWRTLPPVSGSAHGRSEVRLGYRGCWFGHESSGAWSIVGGQVTHVEGDRVESRFDTDCRLESAVLATAPPGFLPQPLP